MTYNSPFDALIASNPEFSQSLRYSGTLDDVLSDVAAVSSPQPTSPIDTSDTSKLALQPPRIIRAVIDYKIQHPDSPEIEVLLREAIDVALGVYSDQDTSHEAVDGIRELVESMGHEPLLTMPLNQPSDGVTWDATHPSRSQRTAQELKSQIHSKDVLFIALAHGGVAAGMDVYLRYCDASGSQDSAFYVARLSMHKLRDEQPRLTSREIDYLRELAQGRQVVVFDEDSATGITLEIAHAYFSSQVFPSQSVMTITNLDARKELESLGFGKELKEIDKIYSDPEEKHSAITKLSKENIPEYYNQLHIKDDMKEKKILEKPLFDEITYTDLLDKYDDKHERVFREEKKAKSVSLDKEPTPH